MTSALPDFDEPDELPEGCLVAAGRFEIVGRRGRGGGATVYVASRVGEGSDVALKVLAAAKAGDPQAEQRFANEARLAQALSDIPGLARTLEYGALPELGDRSYIVQEIVPGPSLTAMLIDHPLPLEVACRMFARLCRTVQALHDRGVVHRDIKPGNILVTQEGDGADALVPWLCDFGYAWTRGDAQTPATAGLTTVFQRPGTKEYMAPEQAIGLPPTPSFDIYSLCATLYTAVVGRRPLFQLSPEDTVRAKCDVRKPEISIAGQADGLPETFVQLVDEGLRRNPGDRIATAAQLADRLERLFPMLRTGDEPLLPAVGDGTMPSLPALTDGIVVATASPDRETPPEPTPAAPAKPAREARPIVRLVPTTAPLPSADAGVAADETATRGAAAQRGQDAARRRSRGHRNVALMLGSAVAALGILWGANAWVGAEPPDATVKRTEPRTGAAPSASTSAASEPEPEPDEPNTEPDPVPLDAATKPESTSGDEPPLPAERPEAKADARDRPIQPRTKPRAGHETPTEPGSPTKPDAPPKSRLSPEHPDCVADRERAAEAERKRQWASVIDATRRKACWPDGAKRLLWRIRALEGLARYDECIQEGRSSASPVVNGIVAVCRAKRSKDTP